MTEFIALLRAVNVGGTGKLSMSDLKQLCMDVGFDAVRTYIASGNVVFTSKKSEAEVKSTLEAALTDYANKPMNVMIRTSAEMLEILANNPFSRSKPSCTVAIFLDETTTSEMLTNIVGLSGEEIGIGRREIYVSYGDNMGKMKLRIPAAKNGTARNMNTVAKLAKMAAAICDEV